MSGIAAYGTLTSTTSPNAAASFGVPTRARAPSERGERPQFLGVARRHQDLVPRLGPVRRQRTADAARADDADAQRLGLRPCRL
jgi:hypothetical protein